MRSIAWLSPLALLFGAPAILADTSSPFRGNPLDTLPVLPKPAASPPPTKIDAPRPAAQADLLAQTLKVGRIDIEGVRSLPFADVARLFADTVNHEVSLRELNNRAEATTRLYQERGYPLSFAYLPIQRFDKGVVKVIVVEGYIGQLLIQGDPGPLEERLRRTLAPLLAERPLTRASFERYTNLIAQLPGISARAELIPPSTTGGAGTLRLEVARTRLQGGVSLENNHPGIRGLFSVTTQALTGQGEQLALTALAPRGHDKESFYGLQYSQFLGDEGTQIKLDVSDYQSRPQAPLLLGPLTLQREIASRRAGLSLSHPLLLSNTRNLTVSGGFYLSHNEDRYIVEGSQQRLTTLSRVTVLNTGLNYAQADPGSVTRVSGMLYQGLDAAGARQQLNDYDLEFTRITTNLSRSDDWPGRFGTVVQLAGQYSAQNLPSSEQVGYGGRLFGRAYPAGEVAGDSGWGASFELQRGFSFESAWLKQVQPFLLVEHAEVAVNRGSLPHHRLGSVALGVRLGNLKHYSLELDVAKPTADIPTGLDKRQLRWNASYSYRFP